MWFRACGFEHGGFEPDGVDLIFEHGGKCPDEGGLDKEVLDSFKEGADGIEFRAGRQVQGRSGL